jgi:hypothetical protein
MHHNICFRATELCYALRSFRHKRVTTGHGECFCSRLVSVKDEKTRQLQAPPAENFGMIFVRLLQLLLVHSIAKVDQFHLSFASSSLRSRIDSHSFSISIHFMISFVSHIASFHRLAFVIRSNINRTLGYYREIGYDRLLPYV